MKKEIKEKKAKKKRTDRSYVAEAFDFEKLAIIFIINIFFPSFKLKNVNYIKMGKKSPSGDIDVSLLVSPNKEFHFQIKSNKNLKNIAKADILKGLNQLYLAFRGIMSQGITDVAYLLAYEGYSNLKETKQLHFNRSPETNVTNFWMENLVQYQQESNKKTSSNILRFLDKTSLLFLPSRDHMKIMLEKIFTLDELRYLTGHLTYDREMRGKRTLKLLHRRFSSEKEQKKDEKFMKKIKKHIEEHWSQFIDEVEREYRRGFDKIFQNNWILIIFILRNERIFDGYSVLSDNFASELKEAVEEKGILEGSPFSIKKLRQSLKIIPTEKNLQKQFYQDETFEFKISSKELTIAIHEFYISEFHHNDFENLTKIDFHTHHFPMDDFEELMRITLNILQVMYKTFMVEKDNLCLIYGRSKGTQHNKKLYDSEIPIYIEKWYNKDEIVALSVEEELQHFKRELEKSFKKNLSEKQFHKQDWWDRLNSADESEDEDAYL